MSSNALDLKNIIKEIDEEKILELRSTFDNYYAQDIAEEYTSLDKEETKVLFDILSYQQGANVLAELELSDIQELLEDISDSQLAKFANKMDLDDAADIIGLLNDERMSNVLEKLQRSYELKELLSYETDTCGGIMSPHFLSLRADLRIQSALRYVRFKARETQNQIIYFYVTTALGELVGVVSLRDLFLAPDNGLVSDHMHTDVIAVKLEDDQETAAELISKYHFLAIPVINENKQLVGIITIDDIVEVIEEETTQDIYQSSGINVDSSKDVSSTESIRGAYRARTPWLIITLIGQYAAAMLIANFQSTIIAIPIAISFMPLLSGMSGNIGNQSVTIVVRGLYTGDININEASRILTRELATSLSIGVTCATITGLISYLMYGNQLLSLLIGFSLIVSMGIAVGLGTITPIAFKKLNWDPATASGPLMTTLIDVISFSIYLVLITRFTQVLI